MTAATPATEWKPIDSAPRDEVDIIVGWWQASIWISCSAWCRTPEKIAELIAMGLDFEPDDAGWWSYRSSVTQEMVKPTHWLREVGALPEEYPGATSPAVEA